MNWNDDWENDFDDQDTTMACPECGAEIYDESEMCPHCGIYISANSLPLGQKSVWMQRLFVVIVIMVILAFVLPSVIRLF